MNGDLDAYIDEKKRLIDRFLDENLPVASSPPAKLHEAIRYAVFPGGKRWRPAISLAAAEVVGANPADVLPAACAVELIHCYSLVHDDLPALDDDDYRRGRPSCHRAF